MARKHDRYQRSARAFEHASGVLPGGVNSPVRAFGDVESGPLFIAAAGGCRIYDIDGNEYIDYVGSWGPMILGHAHPKVIEAVICAAKKGTSFGAPTVAETSLAEKIIAAFNSVEKVRLVSSGIEAVMTAVRLARAFTGRDLIIKMAGGYHGHSDSLLAVAGSGLASAPAASSEGVPQDIARLTCVIPYNDIDTAKTVFENHRRQIAAVLVEPIAANMGVIPPVPGYLQGLRDLCDENNCVLIFDEVITGFRVAAGGAGQLYGINADITCLGKIIGGGLPLAAVGGRSEIMDYLAPVGPVYQAGTLSGNPLATVAANATLDILLNDNCYRKLESTAALLEKGLTDAAEQVHLPVRINRVGSLMSCFFTDRPVNCFGHVKSTNIEQFRKFFALMLEGGIYIAPSAFEAMFVSLVHTDDDIEKTIEAAGKSFCIIKQGLM